MHGPIDALLLLGVATLFALVIVLWGGVRALRKESRLLWGEVARLTNRVKDLSSAGPPTVGPATTAEPSVSSGLPRAPVLPEAVPTPPTQEPAPPRPAVGGAAVVPPALPPVPREPSPREGRPGLEAFVGGRVLLVVGVVIVLFGLGFLLKLAIDRGWIGPAARIAIGTMAGLSALIGGDVLRRRGFDVFGHALMGGGLAALYLCTYFATVRYGFLGLPAGYAASALLTAAGALLALRRNAVLLAYLGFLGGFLAPGFLGWTVQSLPTMTAWMVVLDLGVAAVLWRRRWLGLDAQALLANVACFAIWHERFMAPDRLGTAVLCLVLMTAALLVVALLPALTAPRRAPETSLLTALATGVCATVAGHVLLFPEHRYAFGGGLVVLAAVFAAAARVRSRRDDAHPLDVEALTTFALAAAATSLPVFFSGHAVAPALAFAGLTACLAGARRGGLSFVAMGAAMIALAVCDLVAFRMPPHEQTFVPFVNGVFWSFAAPCVAAALAGLALHHAERWTAFGKALLVTGLWLYVPVLVFELWQYFALDSTTYGRPGEREYGPAAACAAVALYAAGIAWLVRARPTAAFVLPLGPLGASALIGLGMLAFSHDRPFVLFANPVFLAAVVVSAAPIAVACFTRPLPRTLLVLSGIAFLFLAVTADLYHWGAESPAVTRSREDLEFRAQVWVSIAWALYAGGLIAWGFVRGRAYIRWAGLVVFGFTLGKVVLVDTAALDLAYRIGSFLGLGILLVAASFLYQRARRQESVDRLETDAEEAGGA